MELEGQAPAIRDPEPGGRSKESGTYVRMSHNGWSMMAGTLIFERIGGFPTINTWEASSRVLPTSTPLSPNSAPLG